MAENGNEKIEAESWKVEENEGNNLIHKSQNQWHKFSSELFQKKKKRWKGKWKLNDKVFTSHPYRISYLSRISLKLLSRGVLVIVQL